MNKVVKLFILAELFSASAWNAIAPVFSVFAIKAIPGSSITLATTAFSIHIGVRIAIELLMANYFAKLHDNNHRLYFTIGGIAIVCAGYTGFAFITNPLLSYLFYGLLGLGFGLSIPPKMAIFSSHIDQKKGAFVWSVYDVVAMGGSAIAAIIAGVIIKDLGFQTLFTISALLNLLSALPYIFLLDDPTLKE